MPVVSDIQQNVCTHRGVAELRANSVWSSLRVTSALSQASQTIGWTEQCMRVIEDPTVSCDLAASDAALQRLQEKLASGPNLYGILHDRQPWAFQCPSRFTGPCPRNDIEAPAGIRSHQIDRPRHGSAGQHAVSRQ